MTGQFQSRERRRQQTRALRTEEAVSLAESRKEDDRRVKVSCEVSSKDVSSLEGTIQAVDGVSDRDVGTSNDVHDEDVGRGGVLPFVTLSVIDRFDSDVGRVSNPREPISILAIKQTT